MNNWFFPVALAVCGLQVSAAAAATIKNSDTAAQTIVITEKGYRTDLEIPAGSSVVACASGCFIRYPGGQMQVYRGSEVITIQNGMGRISAK